MATELTQQLQAEVTRGGRAYIRNLVAAEQAVLQGQFNVAKILRALAHSQRVLAMEAARLLNEELDSADLFNTILEEIDAGGALSDSRGSPARERLEKSAKVRAGLRDILQRSQASLQNNSDVLESDVAQMLRACYNCGAVMEGDPPHACPICGALSVEFESFAPFYSSSLEHLGQLKPQDIIEILERIPDEIEAAITQVDDVTLRRKPSPDEWSIAEIVGHMLETDTLFAIRVRALLEAQGVELPRPMPPWKLHEGKGYESMQVAELMLRMRVARAQSLSLVSQMTPEQWSYRGRIQGSATSMLDLGTWVANHDRGHLAQIYRLCGRTGTQPS